MWYIVCCYACTGRSHTLRQAHTHKRNTKSKFAKTLQKPHTLSGWLRIYLVGQTAWRVENMFFHWNRNRNVGDKNASGKILTLSWKRKRVLERHVFARIICVLNYSIDCMIETTKKKWKAFAIQLWSVSVLCHWLFATVQLVCLNLFHSPIQSARIQKEHISAYGYKCGQRPNKANTRIDGTDKKMNNMNKHRCRHRARNIKKKVEEVEKMGVEKSSDKKLQFVLRIICMYIFFSLSSPSSCTVIVDVGVGLSGNGFFWPRVKIRFAAEWIRWADEMNDHMLKTIWFNCKCTRETQRWIVWAPRTIFWHFFQLTQSVVTPSHRRCGTFKLIRFRSHAMRSTCILFRFNL